MNTFKTIAIPGAAACLWLSALMLGGNASASDIVVGNCVTQPGGVFGFNNPNPNSPISGSWTCPTSDSLGLPAMNVSAEFIVYDSDYSNGLNTPVDDITKFAFSAPSVTLDWNSDILTSTGGSASNPVTDSQNQTFYGLNGLYPSILAGYWDWDCFTCLNGLGGGATVNYTNTFASGTALQGTGYAQIVYLYGVPQGPCPSGDICPSGLSPEPASVLLFGGGLFGLLLFARMKATHRKFARGKAGPSLPART